MSVRTHERFFLSDSAQLEHVVLKLIRMDYREYVNNMENTPPWKVGISFPTSNEFSMVLPGELRIKIANLNADKHTEKEKHLILDQS